MAKSVKDILADPATPAWVRDGVLRLRKTQPVYSAFLEAIHDYRVGQLQALAQDVIAKSGRAA